MFPCVSVDPWQFLTHEPPFCRNHPVQPAGPVWQPGVAGQLVAGARLQPAVPGPHGDHPVPEGEPGRGAGSLATAGGRALAHNRGTQALSQDTPLGLALLSTPCLYMSVCLSVCVSACKLNQIITTI